MGNCASANDSKPKSKKRGGNFDDMDKAGDAGADKKSIDE